MHQPPRTLDLNRVNNLTGLQQSRMDHYREVVEDSNKQERLGKQECPICFYGTRIGGSAVTGTECSFCGKEMTFGNTNIDVLCHDCASGSRLCKHCGCDVNLKNRKKL